MIRVVGVCLVAVVAAVPGFLINERLARRKSFLVKMAELAMSVGASIKNGGECLEEILKSECRGELSFLKSIDLKLIGTVEEVKTVIKGFDVSESDSAVTAEFFEKLGTSDAVNERKYCEYYALRFEALAREAEKELNEKGRLYRTMFMFFGVAVFVILI